MEWVKTGFNTWRAGDVTVYLASLPHPTYFVLKQGEMRKFTDRNEAVDWIKEP